MDLLLGVFGAASWVVQWLLPFVVVLSAVVIVHELGHFLVGRWCGAKVDSFSIGFGPEIFSFTDKYETRWRVAWLPLGGYVKFFGDMGPASEPDPEVLAHLAEAGVVQEEVFHFKPLWQRAAIILAGPVANFILAILIFAGYFMVVGESRIAPIVQYVEAESPAEAAGILPGDRFVTINGRSMDNFQDVMQVVSFNANIPLRIEMLRDGELVELRATPEERSRDDGFGGTADVGVLGLDFEPSPVVATVDEESPAAQAGIEPGDIFLSINGTHVQSRFDVADMLLANPSNPMAIEVDRGGRALTFDVVPVPTEVTRRGGEIVEYGELGIIYEYPFPDAEQVRFGPIVAVGKGMGRTVEIVTHTFVYLGRVITGRQDADQFGGVLRIWQISGQVASVNAFSLIGLIGILSVSIGLINLFPIPILDGGHLVFYAYEAVFGKPLGEGAQEVGFRVGLAIVLAMMIFATWNDLVHLRVFEFLEGMFS